MKVGGGLCRGAHQGGARVGKGGSIGGSEGVWKSGSVVGPLQAASWLSVSRLEPSYFPHSSPQIISGQR